MTIDNKTLALVILIHSHGLGRVKIKKLIEAFGSAEKIIEAGWNPKTRLLFEKHPVSDWESDLELVEKENVHLISYPDPLYPKNLLCIPDYPLLLYVKGDLAPQDNQGLAVIGTRNATLYGKQIAEKIAAEMAASGISIISGLARGIDTAAHSGALKAKGRTVAIIGSGLSCVYPTENWGLAAKIAAEGGALISEYPMKTAPAKGLFPQRNRIVSGIAQAVCLIESPNEGGSMITMDIASHQKKQLFALPGRVDFPTFEGNHWLIKQKKAELFENSLDLLKYFNATPSKEVKTTPPGLFTHEETQFLQKFGTEEKSIEELVLLTQLPIMQLNVLLTRLVLKKVIKEFPGKIYKKV